MIKHQSLLSSVATSLIAGAALFGSGVGGDTAHTPAGGGHTPRPLTKKQAKARAASKRARKARRTTRLCA